MSRASGIALALFANISLSVVPSPLPQKTGAEPQAFAREMLAAHNAVRRKMGVPPLLWSGQLAERARDWAATLASTGASKMQGIPGQNIGYAVPPGSAKGPDIVREWAAESTNYDYQKNACVDSKLRCHHYTQIVWRASKYVGCAALRDASREIFVCDYDPPGNDVAERPY